MLLEDVCDGALRGGEGRGGEGGEGREEGRRGT